MILLRLMVMLGDLMLWASAIYIAVVFPFFIPISLIALAEWKKSGGWMAWRFRS